MESFPNVTIQEGIYAGRKTLDPELINQYIPNSDVFVNELSKATALLVSTKYNEIQDAVGGAIDRVISQGMSNEDSIKQLKVEITGILAN